MSKPANFLIFGAVAAVLAALAAVWLLGSLLTHPAQIAVRPIPDDLRGRPITFQSLSGATLRGWFAAGRPGAGAVVLMHSLRANREWMLGRARFLAQRGLAVLLFDLQAHGESTGERITFGYRESYDAQAAVNFLRQQCPGEKLGVIGVSLGGAAALLAEPPLAIEALVLEMVYGELDRALANRITMRLGAWSSVLAPLLSWQLQPRLGIGTEALRPLDRVRLNAAPKLFIAGALDRHTTLAESQQLFDAAHGPKELWVIESAAHEDFHKAAQAEYERRVATFFDQYLQHFAHVGDSSSKPERPLKTLK